MQRLATLGSILLPAIAFAAGPFDGPYAGIYTGHFTAEDKGVGHDRSTGAINGWTHKPEPKGFQFGLVGGYNRALDNGIVLGLEADIEGRNKNSDRDFQKHNGVTDTDFTVSSKISSAASLRARLGYQLGTQTLLYATAGYAAASVTRTMRTQFSPFNKESHSAIQGGWTAGFGLDYALSGGLSARLEYRHTDYGNKKVAANLWGEFYKQELREDAVRIGINYQF